MRRAGRPAHRRDVHREVDAGLLAREATPSASSRATAAMSAALQLGGRARPPRGVRAAAGCRRGRQPGGLVERPAHQAALVVGLRFAFCEFEVGLQRRERRADLVRRVGDEASQRGDGRLDARRHAVEGLAEAPDLVAAGDGGAGAEVAGRHAVARLCEGDDRSCDPRAIREPARAARPASAAARIHATAALTSASRPDAGPSDSFT